MSNLTVDLRIRQMYYLMQRRSNKKGFTAIIPKNDFYLLAKSSGVFKNLFYIWEQTGYILSTTPTVDRIDNSLGYIDSNIQFLSYRDNQSKGSKETKTGKHKLGNRVYITHTITGDIKTFISGTEARLFLGLPKTRFYSYLSKNKIYNNWQLFKSEV